MISDYDVKGWTIHDRQIYHSNIIHLAGVGSNYFQFGFSIYALYTIDNLPTTSTYIKKKF